MRQLQSLRHDFTPNTASRKIKAAKNGGGQEADEKGGEKMNEIMAFDHERFGRIRGIEIDGESGRKENAR